MDMKVRSDEIRSYVRAIHRMARPEQDLPEESRRLVLRLPKDSVNISPFARKLQQGHLRVAIEENGRYAEVTDDTSNPVMKLLDEGMSDIKQRLDEMKKLTELMEDKELAIEDRYAAQMKIVDLEGEIDKRLYKLYEDYNEQVEEQGLPPMPIPGFFDLFGMPEMPFLANPLIVMNEVGKVDDRNTLADPITGELVGSESYAATVDKRTELKKAAIKRIMMRELDPEAWADYEEELREVFRKEFRDTADEYGRMPEDLFGVQEVKQITIDPEKLKAPSQLPEKPEVSAPEVEEPVDISELPQTPPDGFVTLPETPAVDPYDRYEIAMEAYVEERLAELEELDYQALNSMRISVMSAELAEESGDYLEKLTNQLTEQFQRFAAMNEVIGNEAFSENPEEIVERKKLLAMTAVEVLGFLRKSVLGGLQQDTTREEKKATVHKVEKTYESDPMAGVRDLFPNAGMTPEEIWDMITAKRAWDTPEEAWQMYRPDLFGSAEA